MQSADCFPQPAVLSIRQVRQSMEGLVCAQMLLAFLVAHARADARLQHIEPRRRNRVLSQNSIEGTIRPHGGGNS